MTSDKLHIVGEMRTRMEFDISHFYFLHTKGFGIIIFKRQRRRDVGRGRRFLDSASITLTFLLISSIFIIKSCMEAAWLFGLMLSAHFDHGGSRWDV